MIATELSDGRSELAQAPSFDATAVMAKASAENFSVASRLIPKRYRIHLLALYGFARFVDDVGDQAAGNRARQLDWVEEELDRAFNGTASHPVFVALEDSVAELQLDRAPFVALIEANRQDQVVSRYERYEDLVQYCTLSANPVGRVVLAIFGRRDNLAIERSDEVCTALQIIEHLQDVKEDYLAGRVYLPREDFERFAAQESDFAAPIASANLRRMVTFEVGRARRLLSEGAALVAMLSGAARLAVAGFVGGGLAQLEAIEAASFDVVGRQIKATKMAVARQTWRAYRGKVGNRQ